MNRLLIFPMLLFSFTAVMGQVPNAPTIGVATAGIGNASITFTPPTTVGGSSITGYTVTSSPGGITKWGISSPIVIGGLTSGAAYTFTVTASNLTGPGAASAASNSVIPTSASNNSDDNYGWAKRISFIVGGGVSGVINTVYQDVAIDKATNAVLIEKADKMRTNLSLGILFTPFVSDVKRTIEISETEKKIIYEHYPKGITFGFFFNPFELSAVNTTQSSPIDLGFGVGYRSGAFTVLATADFFSLRQPKQSFIDKYQGKNLPYTINSQIQTSINTNEDGVYRSQKFTAIGIKIAYTFDIVKSYYSSTR